MTDSTRHWLRKDDHESTKASFPELFFDLVFVFALIQLSETLAADLSFGVAGAALLFIFALWWVWIHTTWVTNLLDAEIEPVRLLLFGLMFLGIVLAIALPKAFGDAGGMGLVFAIAYSGMQIARSLFALYAFRGADRASYLTFWRITIWLAISSVFWIAGGFADLEPRVWLWIAALAIEYVAPIVRYWLPGVGSAPRETLDINGEHMAERCALFVIIALGETILTTGKNASSHMEGDLTPLVLTCAFLSTVSMWWIYFHDGQEKVADKAEDSSAPQATAHYLFTYGHLPIVGGIILAAVGEDFGLSHPDQRGSFGHASALLGGPMLFLAGLIWTKTVSSRFVPWSHCIGIALLAGCFLLVPFATNFTIQILAMTILMIVAAWEYVALKSAKPAAA
jgi:low temperature requirement protein LtrA